MAIELLIYGVVCALFVLVGVALLSALGTRLDREVQLLLGPVVTQAAWACTCSLAVAAGLPVRTFTPWVWGGTAMLAAIGAILLWRTIRRDPPGARLRQTLGYVQMPLLGALLALLALGPYLIDGLIHGYRGSGVPDGWSYVAAGQFLWAHAQDTPADGLSLLHRYGTAFAHMRNVTLAQLGLFSWLTHPGDTQAGAGLLQAMSVCSLTLAAAAFARLRGHTRAFAGTLAVLVALSGWIANLIWLSNYDHGLSLAFAPSLMALAVSAEGKSAGGALCIGLLAAGMMHTYPELSIVVLGTTGAAYAVQAWRDRELLARAGLAILAIATAAALVGIYWPDYLAYLRYQATVRPAQAILRGLVEPRYLLSAFWALGGEHRAPMLLAAQSAAGLVLFAVLGRGLLRLIRRGESALLVALLLLLAGAGFVIGVWQYGYGAFKIILTGWWLIAYTLLLGALPALREWTRVATVRRQPLRWAIDAICLAVLLAVPGAVLVRDLLIVPGKRPQPIADLRAIEELPAVIGNEPVALLVDNLDATAWAVYYLRDLPDGQVRIGDFSGYIAATHLRPHVDPAGQRPWPVFRFVLTDATDRGPVIEQLPWRRVWQKGAYALWDTQGRDWGVVTDVQSGDEVMVAPLPAVPLDAATTRLVLLGSSPGTLVLTSDQPWPPGVATSRAQIACTRGQGTLATDPATASPMLRLRIDEGETTCTIRLEPAAGGPAAVALGRMRATWEPESTRQTLLQ